MCAFFNVLKLVLSFWSDTGSIAEVLSRTILPESFGTNNSFIVSVSRYKIMRSIFMNMKLTHDNASKCNVEAFWHKLDLEKISENVLDKLTSDVQCHLMSMVMITKVQATPKSSVSITPVLKMILRDLKSRGALVI